MGQRHSHEGTTMTDDQLQLDVAAELLWDPKVGSAAIVVSASGGTVTLRGTAGSLREKREARKAAERVFGVIAVNDELRVQILDKDRREDTELRGDVLQALILDGLIPTTVDARVTAGFVTLTGTASWQYERDEAKFIVANVPGVFGIEDRIKLITGPNGGDVKNDISGAFARSARLDAGGLFISTSPGSVTLSGVVRSWAEHDEAMAAAWAAPGVTEVHDHIKVEY
jgi:osmotically-inducible protein OsmY